MSRPSEIGRILVAGQLLSESVRFPFSSRRRHTRSDRDWSSDGSEEHTSELQSRSDLVCRIIRSEEHTSELQSRSDLVCRIIRSEEHTSELQSRSDLVCRLLLEKKNIK